MDRGNVRHVVADGRAVVQDRALTSADPDEVVREAEDALGRLQRNAKALKS